MIAVIVVGVQHLMVHSHFVHSFGDVYHDKMMY